MQKELGKEIQDKAERLKFLKDNCDDIQELDYMRQFTHDELLEMKDELSTVSIKIDDLEIERKKQNKEIDSDIKIKKIENKRLLKVLRQKAELVSEKCFKFIDEENRVVGFYNSDGDLVEQRPAMGNELQKNIFQVNKAV